jgi:hypothetical protein
VVKIGNEYQFRLGSVGLSFEGTEKDLDNLPLDQIKIHHVVELTEQELKQVGLERGEIREMKKNGYIKKDLCTEQFKAIDRLKGYADDLKEVENFLFTYNIRPEDVPKDKLKDTIKQEAIALQGLQNLFQRAY